MYIRQQSAFINPHLHQQHSMSKDVRQGCTRGNSQSLTSLHAASDVTIPGGRSSVINSVASRTQTPCWAHSNEWGSSVPPARISTFSGSHSFRNDKKSFFVAFLFRNVPLYGELSNTAVDLLSLIFRIWGSRLKSWSRDLVSSLMYLVDSPSSSRQVTQIRPSNLPSPQFTYALRRPGKPRQKLSDDTGF